MRATSRQLAVRWTGQDGSSATDGDVPTVDAVRADPIQQEDEPKLADVSGHGAVDSDAALVPTAALEHDCDPCAVVSEAVTGMWEQAVPSDFTPAHSGDNILDLDAVVSEAAFESTAVLVGPRFAAAMASLEDNHVIDNAAAPLGDVPAVLKFPVYRFSQSVSTACEGG